MSAGGVIVRRLEAIENLGSMDLAVHGQDRHAHRGCQSTLMEALDCDGASSTEVRSMGATQRVVADRHGNPLDPGDRGPVSWTIGCRGSRRWTRFLTTSSRKRLSVIVKENGRTWSLDDLQRGSLTNPGSRSAPRVRAEHSDCCHSILQQLKAIG